MTHRGQLAHAAHAVDVLRRLEDVLYVAQVLLPARHAVPVHLAQQPQTLYNAWISMHTLVLSTFSRP